MNAFDLKRHLNYSLREIIIAKLLLIGLGRHDVLPSRDLAHRGTSWSKELRMRTTRESQQSEQSLSILSTP